MEPSHFDWLFAFWDKAHEKKRETDGTLLLYDVYTYHDTIPI